MDILFQARIDARKQDVSVEASRWIPFKFNLVYNWKSVAALVNVTSISAIDQSQILLTYLREGLNSPPPPGQVSISTERIVFDAPYSALEKLVVEARSTGKILDLSNEGQARICGSYNAQTGRFAKPFEEFTVRNGPNMFGSEPR